MDPIEISRDVREMTQLNKFKESHKKVRHLKENVINLDSDTMESDHSDVLDYVG